VTKEISKEAGSLLHTINNGSIDLNKLKGFLARVERLSAPSSKGQVRKNKLAKTESTIK
jgi:hypothetical protein